MTDVIHEASLTRFPHHLTAGHARQSNVVAVSVSCSGSQKNPQVMSVVPRTGPVTHAPQPSLGSRATMPPGDGSGLTDINMTQLIAYSLLFPLAAVGNILVFVALFRNRHRKSRVNMMILHLSLADMIVTFVFLPTEITWHVTIEWVFGNFGCKVYKFLSAFGFYMSSMVLVCISLDRYFAVLHPLKVNDAQRRGKIMLFFAWLISAVHLPPSVIFNVQPHPNYPDFYQCVTFGFFENNNGGEMMYTVFCISFLYFIPLSIIIIAYTRIIIEISKKSRDTQRKCINCVWGRYHGRLQLRRSNMSNIERARTRTLRMTFIIVMAFVWCWTPYALGTLWNFIDPKTFYDMNKHVQDILFIIAVSNSVVNPIIYGRYSISCCRGLCDQAGDFCCLCCCCCGRRRGGRHRLESLVPPPTPHSCKSNGNCQAGSAANTRSTVYNSTRDRRAMGVMLQVKMRSLLRDWNRTSHKSHEGAEMATMVPLSLPFPPPPKNLPSTPTVGRPLLAARPWKRTPRKLTCPRATGPATLTPSEVTTTRSLWITHARQCGRITTLASVTIPPPFSLPLYPLHSSSHPLRL
ncbi:LOW QUALITY PROTEIN: adipokinetic hormone/corazonin-related peptide receptor variant I-like [Scylla paramamosain]|uniref:LOW QUALITY PROTEIN: adipokinetic hormone/corazonin-related peptide receptor variant I-like n=1 Tax=Scylla paramamosain TaxID=85552 RepID=UPI003082ED4E